MRRGGSDSGSGRSVDPDALGRLFDRPGVAVAYLFGSAAAGTAHGLSDVDLA
jgi:predicted nucleotidyltransferase